MIAQVTAGTLIAVGLEKIIPRWRHVRGFFVVPFVVPHVAVALIWLSLFTPTLSPVNAFLDLLGITVAAFLTTRWGAISAIVIADTWASSPFVMLLVLAALEGISSDLDLIKHGINVNAISPGVVDGEHWDGVDAFFAKYEGKAPGQKKKEVGEGVPFGRMGTAQDLTGIGIFLASAEADYIVSQTYNVDGGQWMS